MDADKVTSVSFEVSKALTQSFRQYADERGMDKELFQGIVNGSISAIGWLAYGISELTEEQTRELMESTVKHFVAKMTEMLNGTVTFIDGGYFVEGDDDA